ncbi:MAG TPA: two-component regulator propeller domain-containing protein, partial [Flavisolibacter sp.]
MRKGAILIFFISVFLSARGQNSIGIPQIINFNNTRYQGGAQTWDIKQDKEGRMYFANNEGLITYDGSYWKIYPQPNKTILRSIAIHNNRIYAGGQDEIGYYYPDGQGILQYKSIKDLIPKQYGKFTDVWDTEIVNGSVFFRTWEYIFEYKNDAVRAYKAIVGWEFMKLAGNMLIAQDKKEGLFRYSNHAWQPLPGQNALYNHEVSGMVSIGRDSLLISTLEHGLFMYSNGSIKPKPTRADKSFINSHIYSFDRINENEFVAGTTSEGCLVINSDGDVVQQIARPEGLQNNNVLCVFLDKEKNLWAGLDNGISFIAYNSAIKYIKPAKPNETAGYATRVFDGKLYIATSDGAYVATLSSNTKDLSFSTGD